MREKTIETGGYIINSLSIALFVYLANILHVSDFLRPLRYCGWILLVCGIGLIILSTIALVSNRNVGLIYRGIYGLVRHPMYLGAILIFISYFFFVPHWLILLISFTNTAVIYWFILQGERQNITKFGDAYRRYMGNVPRINLLAGIFRRMRNK